jgi:hypothetical protein
VLADDRVRPIGALLPVAPLLVVIVAASAATALVRAIS